MNTLIYTVAYNDSYSEFLLHSFTHTLFNHSHFQGTLAILTNCKSTILQPFQQNPHIIIIPFNETDLKANSIPIPNIGFLPYIGYFKFIIHQKLDITPYQQIAFFDLDILFNNITFLETLQSNILYVTEEDRKPPEVSSPLLGDWAIDKNLLPLITHSLPPHKQLNSGSFIAPPYLLLQLLNLITNYYSTLDLYTCCKNNPNFSDQNIFNLAVLHSQYKLLDPNLYSFANFYNHKLNKPFQELAFFHATGKNKPYIITKYLQHFHPNLLQSLPQIVTIKQKSQSNPTIT